MFIRNNPRAGMMEFVPQRFGLGDIERKWQFEAELPIRLAETAQNIISGDFAVEGGDDPQTRMDAARQFLNLAIDQVNRTADIQANDGTGNAAGLPNFTASDTYQTSEGSNPSLQNAYQEIAYTANIVRQAEQQTAQENAAAAEQAAAQQNQARIESDYAAAVQAQQNAIAAQQQRDAELRAQAEAAAAERARQYAAQQAQIQQQVNDANAAAAAARTAAEQQAAALAQQRAAALAAELEARRRAAEIAAQQNQNALINQGIKSPSSSTTPNAEYIEAGGSAGGNFNTGGSGSASSASSAVPLLIGAAILYFIASR